MKKRNKIQVGFVVFAIFLPLTSTGSDKVYFIDPRVDESFSKFDSVWVSFFLSPQRPNGKHFLSKLGEIGNLREFRTLYTGGGGEILENLVVCPSVTKFVAHHGLDRDSVASIKKFPRLEVLFVWGKELDLENFPENQIQTLHLEGNVLKENSCRIIVTKFSKLKFLQCDSPIDQKSLEILEMCPSLLVVTAGDESWTRGRDGKLSLRK